MNRRHSYAALASLALTGCAINQTVRPVERFAGKQICIVVDTSVRAGFLDTYLGVLARKGYAIRQLPPGSAVTECAITSTYMGRWSWDLALYLSFADIKVYNNGQLTGQATYDSTKGGANMGKFIKGETKIAELVDQLFPGSPQVVSPKEPS